MNSMPLSKALSNRAVIGLAGVALAGALGCAGRSPGARVEPSPMDAQAVRAECKGRLDFGPWEQIFYGEFDGRRRKRVLVKVIGE